MWDNNIKRDLMEIGLNSVYLIYLAQDRDQSLGPVYRIIYIYGAGLAQAV
jgi:hypothetical protein